MEKVTQFWNTLKAKIETLPEPLRPLASFLLIAVAFAFTLIFIALLGVLSILAVYSMVLLLPSGIITGIIVVCAALWFLSKIPF